MNADEIDWLALRARASEMADRAYAPYSQVHVGAAAVCDDGRIYAGCNVENASSGVGICAEVNMVGHMVAAGGARPPKPLALSVVAGDHLPLVPCGRCRQFLFEFGGPDLLVELDERVVTLGELLPHAFGPGDTLARADKPGSTGELP